MLLELIWVVDDKGTEELIPVGKRGLVHDDLDAFGLDALHDALDGGDAEVVAVGLHGEAVHADDGLVGLILAEAGDLQHPVRDEVLSGSIGFYDSAY